MVPILKMRRFSCLLRLSLLPEMGEIAQTFMSEIEWLAALKCRTVQVCQHQIAQHSDNSTFRSFWDIIKSSCNLFYVELSYLFSCQDRETNSEEDEDDANNDTIGPLLPTPKVI